MQYMVKETSTTHVYVKKLQGVVQTLHPDLYSSAVASAPAHRVATEALAGLQSADTSVELGSQPGAGGLQDPVWTLDLPHCWSEQLPSSPLQTGGGNRLRITLNVGHSWAEFTVLLSLGEETEAAKDDTTGDDRWNVFQHVRSQKSRAAAPEHRDSFILRRTRAFDRLATKG